MKENNKLALKTTAIALCVTTVISGIALSISKKSKYEGKEIVTSITYSYDDEKTEVDSFNFENTEDETIIEENINIKELVSNLCINNNYDEFTKEKMIEMFDTIMNNYDNYKDVFKDCLANKNDFVNNLINTIDKNDTKIIVFDDNNNYEQEYENILNNNGATGIFLYDQNKIIVKDFKDLSSLAVLYEEINHSTQTDIHKNLTSYNSAYKLFIEGEPTFYRMIFNDTLNNEYSSFYNLNNNNVTLKGVKGGETLEYGRYYGILSQLAGFDTMNNLKEHFDIDLVKESINKNYDIDCDKLLNLMTKESIDVNDIITIENMYCDCITQKIDSINSKEDCLNVLNQYRFYKNQFGIRINDNNNNYENVTNNYINYGNVENKLLDKIKENDLFEIENKDELFNLIINNTNSISINNITYKEDNNNIYLCDNNSVQILDLNTKKISYSSETELVDGLKINVSNNVKSV